MKRSDAVLLLEDFIGTLDIRDSPSEDAERLLKLIEEKIVGPANQIAVTTDFCSENIQKYIIIWDEYDPVRIAIGGGK